MAEERERAAREQDEPDVEAHKVARAAESSEPDDEPERREGDDPDVEGHSFRGR